MTIMAGYITYNTLERFFSIGVRYQSGLNFPLWNALVYERKHFYQKLHATLAAQVRGNTSSLPTVHVVVPEANIAQLDSHLPQSGFQYVKGRILINSEFVKAKVKYRGDFPKHWAWDKKSLRIKTSKTALYDGMRRFNLQAPKRASQLANFQSFELANAMGLLGPRARLVRLSLNGKNRGIYVLIEQLGEITLRNADLMPGDIYRGEIIAKDQFAGLGGVWQTLFDSASIWDKVAVNNHYAESAMAPLKTLVHLLSQRKSDENQQKLSEMLDMKAWGRFSAFQALAGTKHFTWDHNWRLYYDPWRGKFIPIVWDPVGWDLGPLSAFAVIRTKIFDALFRNGDFLRARNSAFEEFFRSETPVTFLDDLSATVHMMETEVTLDPYLKPADTLSVVDALRGLQSKVAQTFSAVRQEWINGANPQARFHYDGRAVNLAVGGYRPTRRLRLVFDKDLHHGFSVSISYLTPNGTIITDVSASASIYDNNVVIDAELLANHTVNRRIDAGNRPLAQVHVTPGYYQIHVKGLDPNTKILSAEVNRGLGWIPAQAVDSITPTVFSQLYAPVAVNTVPEPTVWSGEVTLEGHQILDRPLVIEPGTTVNLAPGATLVLKHRLTAIGTREAPIRFVPVRSEQEPWGAVVLSGRGADGSTLSHCEMAGGSGLKGDLFEYSAMLSIHDVKDVVISDCQFRDNHVVDDMVHTVYTDIRFERVLFKNALSDALDLDISTASISDSHFENSGNDAVDLMTTQASITGSYFKNNGDKGISVGENSQLYAANNTLKGNLIGVQSKDRSTAVLLNHTLKDNKTGLHAYKKNWRYGDGGVIFLGKSTVSGGGTSASAEKRSVIQIFDSYLETPAKGKRVDTIAVEHQALRSALKQDFLPSPSEISPRLTNVLQDIPPELLRQASHAQRGNRIDG